MRAQAILHREVLHVHGLLTLTTLLLRTRFLSPTSWTTSPRRISRCNFEDWIPPSRCATITLERIAAEDPSQPGRDQEAFMRLARDAYKHANLEAHEKKEKRRATRTKVWGAEVESLRGLVGPVRARLIKLAQVSVSVASQERLIRRF